mmetsp:Transcript_82084/g.95952  ORF Transcript_82084/g.95952 Transcript_82084/m.95952 type:complete len:103 (+) Transcript_82084:2609-2917(+)
MKRRTKQKKKLRKSKVNQTPRPTLPQNETRPAPVAADRGWLVRCPLHVSSSSSFNDLSGAGVPSTALSNLLSSPLLLRLLTNQTMLTKKKRKRQQRKQTLMG